MIIILELVDFGKNGYFNTKTTYLKIYFDIVFIVNFEHISQLVLVFLLLTLNM